MTRQLLINASSMIGILLTRPAFAIELKTAADTGTKEVDKIQSRVDTESLPNRASAHGYFCRIISLSESRDPG